MPKRGASRRDNAWIAEQLRELSARLALDDAPHRSRAYRRAAETLEQLARPAAEIWTNEGSQGLDELPGVGSHIAAVIGELIDSGQTRALERLRRKVPIEVMTLLAVDGIGPKTLKVLWQELRIRTLEELERALREKLVQGLPGFGPRREARLLEAVRIARRGNERMALEQAEPIAERLLDAISRHASFVDGSVAGSIRRGRADVGDIDLVVASTQPEAVAALLLEHPDVAYVYSHGPHRVSVRLTTGVDVDLRTVAPASFGAALLYFTGSRAHTLAMRRLALAQGFRLNEYGLFRGRARIAGETEREIYEALSVPFVPPEQRRGEAEIRDAMRKATMGSSGSGTRD
jgi:DNA polymerase (family 10)